MATLTQVASISRKTIKYSGLVIVAYITLRYSIIYGWQLYLYLNPPPPPPPTVGFGIIPRLMFPDNPGYSHQFILQTPDNRLPSFTTKASVFYVPYQRATFLATDQATTLANNLGFLTEPSIISEDLYEWRMTIPALKTLQVNIVNASFSLSYQWQSDPNMLQANTVFSEEEALRKSQSLLSRINRIPTDVNLLSGETQFLHASGNTLLPAVSQSEADFVKVDYFRNPINNLQVVTPSPERGIISLIITGSADSRKQVTKLEYDHFPVNYNTEETYPLKSVAQAWTDLQEGSGFAAVDIPDSETIYIRRIYLAYYDPYQAQEFLQPIYIFDGDNGTSTRFTAYVTAIDQQWTRTP